MKNRGRGIWAVLVPLCLTLASCGEKEAPKFYLAETVTTMHATGQVMRSVNEFDENWNITQAVNYTDGLETSRTLYEIEGDVTRITTVRDGVSELTEMTVTDLTNHTHHSEVYLDGEVSSTVDSTFDADDHLLTSERWNASQDLTLRSEYTNNASGKKLREDVYIGGQLDHYILYTYNADGWVLTATTCQSDGTENGWMKYTYETSEDGNLTQTAYQCDAGGDSQSLQAVVVYDKYENTLSQEVYLGQDTPYMTLELRYVTADGAVSSGIKEE